MRRHRSAVVSIVIVLVVSFAASAALSQPTKVPVRGRCDAVYGFGNLSVAQYTDEEPLVIVGVFQMTVTSAKEFAEHIDTDPWTLPWYDARLSLLAYPGSDVAIPGQTSYAPYSGTWHISGYASGSPPRIMELHLETFGESVLVRDPDEDAPGVEAFEIFLREELALSWQLSLGPGYYNCGRMHTNGIWNAITDTAEGVQVAGKICHCD